ncbi:putative halogenase [Mycena belliarum]|uniref:Halogenase n=1 Tax=Mycena belliarum TaxID=1033014 RepID=A0AAD6TX44_9AGAR|nr:putative halogenase [Mycena belliae]
MSATNVPLTTDILVIGGGPAGSYAAAALAREGFEVTLLERDHFPRYHIGESMLPSVRPFLRFIGAEQKVIDFGFCIKPGAALKFNQHKREGYTDFTFHDPNNFSWNVTRSEFDEILIRNAAENGVRLYEGVSVQAIKFSSENEKKPVAAEWKSDTGSTGEIKFNWLVDASGRTGIMSTKYLKNRTFNKSLRSVASWGYWTGANQYAPGTKRENAPFFEALTDESGWGWFIPLANGKVSVGFVIVEAVSRAKKAEFCGEDATKGHYLNQLKFTPNLKALLGEATFLGEIKSAGDYSYSASHHAGPNFRICGDAGALPLNCVFLAFIDPFFSSGVHLAFGGGLAAAATISASIRGHCTEDQAIEYHTEKVSSAYIRFLVVVMSAYKQITSQSENVLSDIDEDNFDRAFDFIRPVIQGAADTRTEAGATENMVQNTMEFCGHVLGFTDPEMEIEVAERIDPSLLSPDGPALSVKEILAIAGDDKEVEMVLRKVNGRKTLDWTQKFDPNFRGEALHGLSIVLERGSLGLKTAA